MASVCLLGAGCLYLDPLNKPPNMRPRCEFTDNRPCQSDTEVHRGERIHLRMVVSDPDGNEDPSSYGWAAFECDTAGGSHCTGPYDAQHYDELSEMGTEVMIPAMPPSNVRSISVDFEARDDRGGFTEQSFVFPLADAPTLPRDATEASAAPPSRTMYLRSR